MCRRDRISQIDVNRTEMIFTKILGKTPEKANKQVIAIRVSVPVTTRKEAEPQCHGALLCRKCCIVMKRPPCALFLRIFSKTHSSSHCLQIWITALQNVMNCFKVSHLSECMEQRTVCDISCSISLFSENSQPLKIAETMVHRRHMAVFCQIRIQ